MSPHPSAPSSTHPRALSPRAWGALAVVGLVVAFSLSSTLVKSAESPGVLVAFWRLAMVSVVWNVYLRLTGRRVTLRHVRQAFIPGVFFGVNLATFFVGATNNSVANAALIGSLSPFLIVPIGAKLFKEYNDPRALLFALLAFGGTAIVLLNAPPNGDASLRGNVFGVLAMLLWVGYVVSTRHFRRDMDVATFMATISPIAAVAVLPLAIANGDMFGMSARGWAYTLVLTFLTGVAAHGLLVFAQRTIQIGTIGIAQVAQPALAVVWSFLLLGETVRPWQVVGHRDRDERSAGVPGVERTWQPGPTGRGPGRSGHRDERDIRTDGAARRSPEPPHDGRVTVGSSDVLPTQCASVRSRSVMTWAAASMRRSAASHQVTGRAAVAELRLRCARAHRGRRPRRGHRSSRRASSRIDHQTFLGAWHLIRGVHGGQQALAERGLLSAAGVAVPGGRGFERRPRRRDLHRPHAGPDPDSPAPAPPAARRRWPGPCRSRARKVAEPVS